MHVPISIDFGDLSSEFSLTKRQVDELMEETVSAIANHYRYQWETQAKVGLNSTRQMYLNSIVSGSEGRLTKYVALIGTLPNMIENGADAWDMKKNFERSSKRTITKSGGWYLTIPFRFATPGALGENSAFSGGVLPEEVYSAIRKTTQSAKTQYKGPSARGTGLSKDNIPAQFALPKQREAFSSLANKKTFDKYTHKHSIYEGVQRQEKTYERATQGQYVSFRRVGSNSDPLSWIHKGFAAANFAKKALEKTDIAYITDRTIDNYLISAGF